MAKTTKRGGTSSTGKNSSKSRDPDTSTNTKNNSSKKKNGKKGGRGKNHKKEWGDEDTKFRQQLENDNYMIVEMAADGNCLFRSLSDQLHDDQGSSHADVRSAVCDFMEQHEEDFSVFLVLDENEEDEDAADFESYISAMRQDGEWGGNLELVAAAKLYR